MRTGRTASVDFGAGVMENAPGTKHRDDDGDSGEGNIDVKAMEASKVVAADELLDSLGLLEHKAEIQELTGKTWDVHALSFIEKEDLGETTMSVVEKKKFLAAVARATEASKTVAAAAAVALVTGSGTLENS